ncbi:MAG: hypothetical protein OHK0052_21440 [Anaerolineales bacterium]
MQTTRQQILTYLQQHHTATAADLARVLHLTAANVRHHLGILLQEEQIRIIAARSRKGAGRPRQVYALNHPADNLQALLTALLNSLPPETLAPTLQQTAQTLLARAPATNPAAPRLNQAIQRLNSLHYQARWEARPDSPRITLSHCPYAAILPQHPELCQMDAHLLTQLLNAPVEQTARLEPTPHGTQQCIFRLRAP